MSTTTDFDRLARAWLDEGPRTLSDRTLDAALAAVHLTRQRRSVHGPRRFHWLRAWTRTTALAAIIVAMIIGAGAIWFGGQVPESPPATSNPSLIPSSAPSPTTSPNARVVAGWPGNAGYSQPGLYSWDGVTCEGRCLIGVLHNHGSNDVRLSIERISDWTISDADATPVSIAGHQGRYLHITPLLEEWNIDFDGTLLGISLLVERGASQADIDEANAMIDSLEYEQRDTPLGFRLVFRLPSEHWDSPY